MLVSGMLCPPCSQVMQSPPPPVCTDTWLVGWLAIGFEVAWLVVALVGWLVVGGWVLGQLSLAGWLVGCMVRCLLASCWGVCTVPTSSPQSKTQPTCKEEMDTLPNLKRNKQGPHNVDHNMERGGG